ncbi:MAG: hypothetical protein EHM24_25975 [Acidobacteria bacterium]|nr:MAG: hypothetical protein EHM24_25975 [Acidobacteriota bacterium]
MQGDRLEWESLLASIQAELPSPVEQESVADGSVVFVGGQPGEVVVRLTKSLATVSEHVVEWEGPHEAVVRPVSFGTVHWRRMAEGHALAVLSTLIRAARESRLSKYRTCRFCERSVPPEHLHEEDVCQSCAQRHLGVVY